MAFKAKIGSRRIRVLVGEFTVVTLGVLVALALEQLLSNWQEQDRLGDTVASLNEELVDFSTVFRIRLQFADCITDKLDAIDAALAADAAPAAASAIGRPPYFFSSRGGWNSSGAELLARYRGPQTARLYGEAYQGMEEFARFAQLEQADWSTLQTLQGETLPVAAEHRWRLREAASAARNANLMLTAIAEQMIERVETLAGDIEVDQLPVDTDSRPVCLPLSG